jgi:glutamine amidotransferase
MTQPEIAIVDYGMGNLLSVQRGLEYCGAKATLVSDPEILLSAKKVILPGVGAFAGGMSELKSRGLDVAVQTLAKKGVPLMGICLGMQMLFDESDEFGTTQGLGLIHGRVIPIPTEIIDGQSRKIPHIGWNALISPHGPKSWEKSLLEKVSPGESVYFVHSYMARCSDESDCVAVAMYGGVSITAVIERENISGCQFHPEKSGEVGLNVLRRFLLI